MNITILSLFPDVFTPIFSSSIIGRAQKKGLVKIKIVDIRNFADNKRRSVDDKPYGGGKGMLLRIDVLDRAVAAVKSKNRKIREKIILLDPKGRILDQAYAKKIASYDHLIIICGHYEGFDHRIKYFITDCVSIGKFVLTGGEIPAMVICDSVIRLRPGVLAKEAYSDESFFAGEDKLESPQYTRPPVYKKYKVPSILLSGHHQKISDWKHQRNNIKLLK